MVQNSKQENVRRVLAERRDESAFPIKLVLPTERLIDFEHCESLGEQFQQFTSNWVRQVATTNLWERLPEKSGLYMFVWEPKFEFAIRRARKPNRLQIVLYVGMADGKNPSSTIRRKYQDEYSKYVEGDPNILWQEVAVNSKNALLARHLALHPIEFWFAEWSGQNVGILARLEKKLCSLLNPPVNISVPEVRGAVAASRSRRVFAGG